MFAGSREMMESHRRIGLMLSTCSMLEGELAYLNWQLFAFDWDKKNSQATEINRQNALRDERGKDEWSWDTPLKKRANKTGLAFGQKSVKDRLKEDDEGKKLAKRWADIRVLIEDVAQKRNDYAHSSLKWRAGALEREFGKLWGGTFPTSEEQENELSANVSRLVQEVGALSTELGFYLPFADNNLRLMASIG